MGKIPDSPSTNPEHYEKSSKPSAPDGWRPTPLSVYQRNNNPPIPQYRPPKSQYNQTNQYQIPGLLSRVVEDLRELGGDLHAFLQEYADTEPNRQLLMFALYQKFQEKGNADAFGDWQALIETHRLAKLSIVQARILHEMGDLDDEDTDGPKKRGRPAKNADVTKVIIGRILADDTPHRGPGRPPTVKPPAPPYEAPPLTDEQIERKRQQDAIMATLHGKRTPPDTPTD